MRTPCLFLALSLLACTSGNQSRPTSAAGAGGEGPRGAPSAGSGGVGGAAPALPICPDPIDLGVHLVGRYDGCDESGVRMSWSGTGFVARFQGTGLDMSVHDSTNYYTVLVDGALGQTLVTNNGEETYSLAADLEPGEHVVEVYRRTEALEGAALITGIEVVDGELLSPPSPPARRIEVVGDSITCGYGNEGPDTSCSYTPDTENHYLTYGALLARHFDAELSTVAWSGKGVVSNYDGDLYNLLPSLYERAVPNDSKSGWGFEWQPQAVIINLGTNDYSTDHDPADEDFVAGYEDLLKTIRKHYPEAFILCTVGPMLSGSDLRKAETNIAAAVALRNEAGDHLVGSHSMTTGNPSPACDWHPNLDTHAAMAEELAEPLADALGW